MAPKHNDGSPRAGLDRDLEHVFGGIDQPELERLTLDAIRKYRASVAIAESTRLDWLAAEADANSSPERRNELRLRYENADAEHRARQLVLNNLVDRLGWVPKVPAG